MSQKKCMYLLEASAEPYLYAPVRRPHSHPTPKYCMNPDYVTALLVKWQEGNPNAFDELFPLVYDELKRIANGYLRRERSDHTLVATALVHEAYLKMVDTDRMQWQNRVHFVRVAARAMRRILVSYARQHNAEKRGGQNLHVTLVDVASDTPADDLLALDEALERLEQLNPRLKDVVELRYFGGLTAEETGAVLNISRETVTRDWKKAKAWLYRALQSP